MDHRTIFSVGRRTLLCTGLTLACAASSLHAEDLKLADGAITGSWNTRIVAGASMRTSAPSKHLVGKGFRSDGKPKGGDGADTADDGNLNYGKGDVFSNLYKIVTAR